MKNVSFFDFPAVPAWAVSLCAVSGVTLLLTGVICFFAYNWQHIGALFKLGVPLVSLLACAYTAYRKGLQTGAGQVLSAACGVFLGIFWAVYGQVFQTGAFVYEFFGTWALCLLPLVLLAGSRWLWLLWAAVVNGYIASYGLSSFYALWVVFGFNTGCFIAAETVFYKTKRAGWFSVFFLIPALAACFLQGFTFGYGVPAKSWLCLGLLGLFFLYAARRRRGALQLGLSMLALNGLLLDFVGSWTRWSATVSALCALCLFTVGAWAVYALARKKGEK